MQSFEEARARESHLAAVEVTDEEDDISIISQYSGNTTEVTVLGSCGVEIEVKFYQPVFIMQVKLIMEYPSCRSRQFLFFFCSLKILLLPVQRSRFIMTESYRIH